MRRATFALLASGLLCPLAVFAQNLDWKAISSYTKNPVKDSLSTRLTEYVKQDTSSSSGQLKFAKNLVKELRSYGWNASQEKNGLVWVQIPSNVKTEIPEVVFVTYTNATAQKVTPLLHENYKGGEIALQQKPYIALDIYNSPQLTRAYGHTLLTTNGTSTLGSIKAGAAIGMEIARFLDKYPAISHGPITLAFAPGEEGLITLAHQKKSNRYTYTLEGTEKGNLTDQTFTVRSFQVTFEGNRNIPLGIAGNSSFADNLLIASDFHSLLPRANRPETTSADRGFIYVNEIVHDGDKTKINGVIQAFSEEELNRFTQEVTRAFNTVKAMHNKAKNFSLVWENKKQNIQNFLPEEALVMAEKAMRAEEITPKRTAARLPTASAVLTANGLPSSALFTGHYNDETSLEYVDVDEMENAFRTAMQILSSVTTQGAVN